MNPSTPRAIRGDLRGYPWVRGAHRPCGDDMPEWCKIGQFSPWFTCTMHIYEIMASRVWAIEHVCLIQLWPKAEWIFCFSLLRFPALWFTSLRIEWGKQAKKFTRLCSIAISCIPAFIRRKKPDGSGQCFYFFKVRRTWAWSLGTRSDSLYPGIRGKPVFKHWWDSWSRSATSAFLITRYSDTVLSRKLILLCIVLRQF